MKLKLNENELETFEIKIEKEVLSEEKSTLFKLPEAKVSATFYWDAHGHKVPWEGPNGKKSMNVSGKNIELVKTVKVEKWEDFDKPFTFETWDLYVNGSKVDMGEITSYAISSDRKSVKLKSCMGAG